jgi:DNA-directed RNA polymerase I and III subunit RPAC2
MNLRIQTWDGVSVMGVLKKGLQDLADLCDVVEEEFVAARDAFDAAHPDRMSRR